jgi:hypothetical protein
MRKSNFENVVALQQAFNVANTSKDNIDWDVLAKQFKFIHEEYEELRDKGLGAKNWKEVKDAIGDILVVTYGMAYRCNIDANQLMDNISASNFSKLCSTPGEAATTVKYYASLGVETYVEQTELNSVRMWAIKSSKDQNFTEHGEYKHAGQDKFLKNTVWHEPDLNVEL